MYWTIILLSILPPVLLLALLVVVDGRNVQPVRVSRRPKPAGSNGQAARQGHAERQGRIGRTFSMF